MLSEAELQKAEQEITKALDWHHLPDGVMDIMEWAHALLTAVRQLQAELIELRRAVASETEASRFREKLIEQECDRLADEIVRLSEWLQKNGKHISTCRWWAKYDARCTCGLAALQMPREGR